MSERHEGREGGGPGTPAEPSAEEPLLRALRPGFAREVQQACARITEDLLALEAPGAGAQGTAAHRGRALRLLHGLQGSAATLGAPALSALAQALAARLRTLPTPVPRPAGDALLHGLEQLLHQTQAWAAGAPLPLPPPPDAPAPPPDAPALPAAALAARLWALQARLERGAEALAQASAGLDRTPGLEGRLHAQLHERLHEGLRALSEGSAQARALAAVLLGMPARGGEGG